MNKHPALVGIIPRKNLWDIIQEQRWYHIPVESAPKNAVFTEYLGFYFPAVFGEERRYKVNFYAKVKKVDTVKRIELFPEEKEHQRANKDYFQFHLEEIKELPKPIPSIRWRRIVHIPTSCEKLFTAEEINDLYDTSPLEEKMYLEMKKREIATERQVYVKVNNRFYCLDFGIFCKKGDIDLECDGEKYHILPKALAKDRERNNELTSFGWRVLRFSGKEINRTIKNCFKTIETTIENLGGISEVKVSS
ncbi:endonuclease domain-containing protein [Patescibacteria group bacterium]|nr:endonuclease domain-containing protein [Patescibacteria group bacterium]